MPWKLEEFFPVISGSLFLSGIAIFCSKGTSQLIFSLIFGASLLTLIGFYLIHKVKKKK